MADPSVLARLFESGKYHDFKIQCHGQTFKVHKSIICTQSSVMAAAIDNFKEGIENCLEITEYSSQTVEQMVHFMYKGAYALDDKKHADRDALLSGDLTTPTAVPLLQHVRVNAIANYYDISVLARLATKNAEKMLAAGDPVNQLVPAVQEAFECSDDVAMHDALAASAAKHVSQFINHPDFSHLDKMAACAFRIVEQMKAPPNLKDVQKHVNAKLYDFRPGICNIGQCAWIQSARQPMVVLDNPDDLHSLEIEAYCPTCNNGWRSDLFGGFTSTG